MAYKARHDSKTASRSVGRYLHSALDLRNNIELNVQDYQYAFHRHGEIRYLLDSNVVRFFLNPAKEPESVSLSLDVDLSVTAPLAIVTAEFLFSRELCGQWGSPALISPAHAKELESHADHLVERMKLSVPAQPNDDNFKARITKAIEDARNPERLQSSINQLFAQDHDTRQLISDEMYEARMLHRVSQEELLAPLALDEYATSEVFDLDQTEIKRWAARIERHRAQRYPRARPGFRNRETKDPFSLNNMADAETIMQLLLLNRNALKEGRNTRYVLVTMDQSLHNTLVEWLASNEAQPTDTFPLRRLGQYIPVLNTGEMPNQVEDITLITSIRDAVDGLLTGIFDHEHTFPCELPALDGALHSQSTERLKAAMRVVKLAEAWGVLVKFEQAVERMRTLWSDLGRDSVYLNATLLSRRIQAFADLSGFLSTASDVREAVLRYMDLAVAGVEQAHVEFAIKSRLAAEIARNQTADRGVASRGMLMLQPRFTEFTGSQDLYSYLGYVTTNPEPRDLDQLFEAITSSGNHRAMLFAGCVAFWASGWESALFFGRRASRSYKKATVDETKPSQNLADIGYFLGVATRYYAMDLDGSMRQRLTVLREALEFLDKNLEVAELLGDRFLIVRARIERGLTLVTCAYAQSLMENSHAEQHEQTNTQPAFECFDNALAAFNSMEDVEKSSVVSQMKAEICVGLAGCILHHFFFDSGGVRREQINELDRLSEQVRDAIGSATDIVPAIYESAARLLDIMHEESDETRRQMIVDETARMKSLERLPRTTTRLDVEVLRELADRLPIASETWAKRNASSTV